MWFSNQGSNSCLLQWKHAVLTAGLSGKPHWPRVCKISLASTGLVLRLHLPGGTQIVHSQSFLPTAHTDRYVYTCAHVYTTNFVCMYTNMYACVNSFPGGSEVKNLLCDTGDSGSIPGSGRSLGEGNGNLVQYSCLENPMDRGAWRATVHGVAKSCTRLSDYHFHSVICVCAFICACVLSCFSRVTTHSVEAEGDR